MRQKKNSGFKRIFVTGLALVAGFLILPVIFPQDAAMIDKQLAAQAEQDAEDAASMPVVFSDNPLAKYFKKLANFYAFGSKKNKFTPDGNNLFAYGYGDEYPTASANEVQGVFSLEDTPGAAASIIYTAKDGTIISPDENGYYYGDTYYANGQYPSADLKKSIESSISKYHAAVAQALGRKAVYAQNPDGSLTVKYVSQEDYDKYLAGGTMPAEGGSSTDNYNSSSNRYTGATIASKQGSSTSSASAGKGISGSGTSGGLGDLSGKFKELSLSLSSNKEQTAKDVAAQEQKEKEDMEKKTLELLSSADKFRSYLFVDPASDKGRIPAKFDEQKYGNSPLILDKAFANKFLPRFGIEDKDYASAPIPTTLTKYRGKSEDFKQNILNAAGNNQTFRVIGGQTGYMLNHIIDHLGKDGNRSIFFDHIAAPQNDPSLPLDKRKSFTQAFMQETGLNDILVASGVNKDKIESIAGQYQALDDKRERMKKAIQESVAKDPNLRGLKTSATFFLGKDKNGQTMIATPRSFLYVYAPPAPQWIQNKYDNDPQKRAYLPVAPEELAIHLQDNGNITIVQTDEERKTIQALGAHTTAVIPSADLGSYYAPTLSQNINTLGQALYSEMNRVATSSQKQSLNDAKQKIEDLKKKTTSSIANAQKKSAKKPVEVKKTGIPLRDLGNGKQPYNTDFTTGVWGKQNNVRGTFPLAPPTNTSKGTVTKTTKK